MDGKPYLRKVDVASYDDYDELAEALSEMFCYCSISKLAAMLREINQKPTRIDDACVYNKPRGGLKLKKNCAFYFISCGADGHVWRPGACHGV